MKIRNLVFGLMAAVGLMAACQEEQNLGTPKVSLSISNMDFEAVGGSQTVELTATRDWMVENDQDWLVVSPESGNASAQSQQVTVTVLENKGLDREASLKFTIGMGSKTLKVTQAGPGGSAADLIVYSNNFDKKAAVKDGNYWPYPEQSDCWQNQTGTGASAVGFGANNVTVRDNLNSDTYAGASGTNNIFFGKVANYFMISDIAMPASKDFTLSFGTIRNEYNAADNTFKNNEFHVWISGDGKKWTEIDYAFAEGPKSDTWDMASGTFSLSAAVSKLYVTFTADVASTYRLDDLSLTIASAPGKAVNLSAGVEKDFTASSGSGNEGGSTSAPESKGKKTVQEFISAADTQNYYELTGTVSGFNPTYCSFDLTDATGKIYVYSVLAASKTEWTDKISNGGTITIYGKYLWYEQKSQHEVVDAHIVSFTAGEGGGNQGGTTPAGKPESLTKVTIAEFLDAPESTDKWYELTGEIISIAKQDYGNFTIKDATGEVYIYGMTSKWVGSNDKSFSQIGLKVGDTVTLGTLRGSYNGSPQGGGNPVPAYYISHTPGEGGSTTPPSGEAGEYDPKGITWTLGANAYDKTSGGTNVQTATVNGVSVSNLLKLGTGSKVGDATLHVPAGTAKIGFYCLAWNKKTAQAKFSIGGSELTTISPASNTGAAGNPPYTITVQESDYYEITLPSKDAVDIKVETLDPNNGRVLLIGLKAIAE